MRFAQQRSNSGRLGRWPIGWALVACFAAGVAGLTWLALALLHSSAAGPAPSAAGPASPPVRVCGNNATLGGGPSSPPKGAIVIPAGDDSGSVLAHNWTIRPDTTYWFAPGTHTLGTGRFAQIVPARGDTFIGTPGAVLDRRHVNLYA